MPDSSAPPCTHCGLACTDQQIHNPSGSSVFCCHGCLGAYQIITGAGLQEFYDKRQWQEPGTPEHVFQDQISPQALSSYIKKTARGDELILLIEGIRCATCVWLIEKILTGIPGVERARVNYATHRLRVIFDPELVSAPQILDTLRRIGYLARPYSENAAQAARTQEHRTLLIRFGTAAFLSMQLMGYSLALYAGYFQGIDHTSRLLIQILAGIVTTPVVFYSGAPFLAGAWQSIKNHSPNMDLLISLGVLTAYGYSLIAIVEGEEVFFDTAAMIVTLILLGRLFENAARHKASSGIDQLLNLTPELALRFTTSQETEQVASRDLNPGDRILIRPGDCFPVDGVIVAGSTEVDESIVSGEAIPVFKRTEMNVTSGSVNLLKAIEVQVTHAAANSFIAKIAHMVEESQLRKAPIQKLADRIAVFFVPAVMICAALTFLFWFSQGSGLTTSLLYAIAVLVVACPCALGLATPTAVLVASGSAASLGILFRGGNIIEETAGISIAGFDKTGTLTCGKPEVKKISPARGEENELLTMAAHLESSSNHPLARGIIRSARRRGLPLSTGMAEAIPGQGLTLHTNQGTLRGGSRQFIKTHCQINPTPPSTMTEVHFALDKTYQGCIYLEDQLRHEALQSITDLKRLGIYSVLLTGDHADAAKSIATTLGIDYLSQMTPTQKSNWVTEQLNSSKTVLMVGDGINDAPALSAASVGCAMAGGSDIALENSDLALTKPNLNNLIKAIKIARKTMRIIHQNLFWAFFYNLLMLPLAASGNLAPIYAAGAMAASSICVISNSLRLKRVN